MQLDNLPLPVQLTLLIEQVAYVYHIPPHELLARYSLSSLITLAELANYRQQLSAIAYEPEEQALPKFVRLRNSLIDSLLARYHGCRDRCSNE